MNLYLRYFEREILVSTVDEAIDFLKSIPEIEVDEQLEADVRSYAASNVYYPKRYKLRPRVYFIIIKTEAATMLDFKQKKAVRQNHSAQGEGVRTPAVGAVARLQEERFGWYEGALDFKRVMMVPATGKYEYRDTHFVARCKANSPQECYERIVEYLSDKIDRRSQIPSAKGKNFTYKFLGICK